jgi:3'-5' exoribonuclease
LFFHGFLGVHSFFKKGGVKLITKTSYVKEIKAGDRIDDSFLVSEKSVAYSQKGSPYLNLRLKDRTGEVDGKVWENALAWDKTFKKGDFVHVQARALSFKNTMQLSISAIRRVEDSETDIADYLPVSRKDRAEMFAKILGYCRKVQTPCLSALLDAFFGDQKIAELFQKAPAAKGLHHTTIGGLLEHTLSVVTLLEVVADHYEGLNKDLLITGGLLHDIGKVHEFSYDRIVDYSDSGRLLGHIVIGLEMIDERIAGIEDFPEQIAMELRHLIISHHGMLEYGSPKRPKTLEALVVHYIDDLDAKVNAFQEYMKTADAEEESDWTPYHRLFGRYIYKGKKGEIQAEGSSD